MLASRFGTSVRLLDKCNQAAVQSIAPSWIGTPWKNCECADLACLRRGDEPQSGVPYLMPICAKLRPTSNTARTLA